MEHCDHIFRRSLMTFLVFFVLFMGFTVCLPIDLIVYDYSYVARKFFYCLLTQTHLSKYILEFDWNGPFFFSLLSSIGTVVCHHKRTNTCPSTLTIILFCFTVLGSDERRVLCLSLFECMLSASNLPGICSP